MPGTRCSEGSPIWQARGCRLMWARYWGQPWGGSETTRWVAYRAIMQWPRGRRSGSGGRVTRFEDGVRVHGLHIECNRRAEAAQVAQIKESVLIVDCVQNMFWKPHIEEKFDYILPHRRIADFDD